MLTDVRKSAALLAVGHLVVRLREDGLSGLEMDSPHYKEIRVYSTAPRSENAMEEISRWLDALELAPA